MSEKFFRIRLNNGDGALTFSLLSDEGAVEAQVLGAAILRSGCERAHSTRGIVNECLDVNFPMDSGVREGSPPIRKREPVRRVAGGIVLACVGHGFVAGFGVDACRAAVKLFFGGKGGAAGDDFESISLNFGTAVAMEGMEKCACDGEGRVRGYCSRWAG